MANKKLGDILRMLRNAKGYTQQQVADILALKNKSTLGSWEVGKSEPDAFTFLKLCKIYEVKDIYSAFDEVAPKQLPAKHPIVNKYELLNDDYKEFIEIQIDKLLQIQQKNQRN